MLADSGDKVPAEVRLNAANNIHVLQLQQQHSSTEPDAKFHMQLQEQYCTARTQQLILYTSQQMLIQCFCLHSGSGLREAYIL